MDSEFGKFIESISYELCYLSDQFDLLDLTLAKAAIEDGLDVNTLQIVDQLRQQANGLAKFVCAVREMSSSGQPLDFIYAAQTLPLAAQSNRLQGKVYQTPKGAPELW